MSSSVNCTFFTRNQYQPISCRMSKIQQTFVVPVGCGAWKNPITVFIESLLFRGFRDSSVGKESACNIGDLSSIPGSPWRRDRLPTPVFLVFPVAQLVKNPPAMQETWVPSLGLEDPLEKGAATHSSILARRIPWTLRSMGSQRVRHDWAAFSFLSRLPYPLAPKFFFNFILERSWLTSVVLVSGTAEWFVYTYTRISRTVQRDNRLNELLYRIL